MDRIRRIGGMIKEKYNKPCCIKVGVGVGVGLLVLIVVVVVATVATGRGGDSDVDAADNSNGSHSGSQPQNQQQKPVVWPHKFGVQLEAENFAQELAVNDTTQTYVIEISNNQHFNLYIIVDFKKRQHHYVGIEKVVNSDFTNVVEKKVLFCHRSSFREAFNGEFVPFQRLRDGGTTYREQANGRTVTLDTRYVGAPYTLSSTLAAIVSNESCQALTEDQTFHWSPPLSHCGDNTTLPVDNPTCSNSACPPFPKAILSTRQACTKFRECNYDMSYCDSFWKTSSYDGLPYCVCRKTIVEDMDSINCPSAADDEGECTIPVRDLIDFEAFAPCYCRYQIPRIYPVFYPTSRQTISWVVRAVFTTAPAKNYKECPC